MQSRALPLFAMVGIAGVLSIVSAQEMDEGMEMGVGGGDHSVNFERQILPLLREGCFECHSEANRKPKGNLRLDGRNWILAGGKHGSTVVPGDPKKSALLARVSLPDEHDDVMPPSGEVFSKAQLRLIELWIKEGARFGDWKGKGGIEEPKPVAKAAPKEQRDPFRAYRRLGGNLAPAPGTAIRTAIDAGARVSPVFPGSPLLRVEFVTKSNEIDDRSLKALGGLRKYVAILGLRDTAITDTAMGEIGKFPNLVRLDVPNTGITDQGLKTLAQAKPMELAVLNLYGTAITDGGLDTLNSPRLAKVYLWKTKVTAAGADMLGKRVQGCRVVFQRDMPAAETRSANGNKGRGNRKKKKK